MAGIYIHIPFCKQKCSYCDFHFSTRLKDKSEMVKAIQFELSSRSHEINEKIESIYFGGGTPSLLSEYELNQIFETLDANFNISPQAEITLEANPDDLNREKIQSIKNSPINRFSIGIQSFFDEDLKWMNRAHSASEADSSIKRIQDSGWGNITIDLIYGSPTTSDKMWNKNIQTALDLHVPHISAYALTVEPKTFLHHQIQTKKIPPLDEGKAERQYQILIENLIQNQFIHYEISNFGKKGFLAVHNSNYWKGVPYLGIGPSAHSFNGEKRRWNAANNSLYLKGVAENNIPFEAEKLSAKDQINERFLIGLRTIWGVDLNELKQKFDAELNQQIQQNIQPLLVENKIKIEGNRLKLNPEYKFFADGIAAELFIV